MTFNIEWGGTHVSFDKVIEAVRRSNPDVAGIQEAEGNLARLARELGWNYDERNYVISRLPLLDPPEGDGKYVLVETSPGQVVAIANLHLPSDPYGPDLVRDGASLSEVIANERSVRLPALQPYLDLLPALPAAGIPLFVTGDFNTPAHTDWTAELVGNRKFLRYPVEWPVSLAMQEAGFRDSWRVLHPDPAAQPGLTWWAGRPPLAAYAPGENDAQDRIDQVWFAGEAVPVAARVVGESGGPGVTIEIDPWPSDHRAVLVDFTVQAAPMPGLLTTDRHVYLEGERVEVRYAFTSEVAGPITIRDLVNDVMLLSQAPGAAQGRFEWAPRAPGHYGARAAAGGTSYEREFWVLARDAVPAVELDSDVYLPGEPVEVRWRNAPGYRNDYIALFPADSTGKEGEMLGFAYVRARPEGRMDLRHALGNGGGLLTPGRYQVRLMKDDGYEAMAVSDIFEIR